MATLSTFSGAMKTKFIGPIRDQLNSNKILLFGLRDKMDEGDQPDPQGSRDWRGIEALADGIDFVGNEFRLPLRTSRNQGIGSRNENETLPAPGNEGFVQISEPLRYHYGLFNITGQLIKASESNEGAFKRALSVEMNGTTDALKRKMNIDAYGNATGNLTLVRTGAGPVNTFDVDSTISFQIGEIVDIVDAAGAVYKGNARVVTALSRTTRTLTINGAAVTVVAGDRVVRASSDSTSGVPNNDLNKTINGLENIIAPTGILHTLNPATAGYWVSTQVDAAGAIVGDQKFRELIDGIGFESGSDEEVIMITTRGVRTRYANQLTQFKRFNDAQSVKLRGGFTAIMFDDKPMVIDDQCPKGRVYALQTKSLFWSQMSDWEWMDLDGETLKWEPRLDRYIGILFKYCQLGTWARNQQGKIINAADDVM